MAAIVSIYKRDGTKISEFVATASRSWTLNQYTIAKILVPYSYTNVVQEEILRIGNFLVIDSTSEYDVPTWAGIIEHPKNWSANGLEITAYSAEYILFYRCGPKNLTLFGNAGSLFKQILNYANSIQDTRIAVGEVYEDAKQRQETINYSPLYDDITRILGRTTYDWEVVPAISSDGKLGFVANMYQRKGYDSNFTLREGYNLISATTRLSEQGMVVNDVYGFGDGATWDVRPSCNFKDTESIGIYGLRQHGKENSGITQQATLEENTKDYINYYSMPRIKISASVHNIDDTFKNIRIGNRINIELINYGFTGSNRGIMDRIKIDSIAFNEDKGVIDIVSDKDEDLKYD